jgi:UDPglucose 6-dehydrogenase
MRIGVVGYGTVGKAATQAFRERGHSVYINDVKLVEGGVSKAHLMELCDIIFICVETPCQLDGCIDLSRVEEVVSDLCTRPGNPVLVVKSTVVPGTTVRLASEFPEVRFAANPEFCRQSHAYEDFMYPDRIVIGALDPGIADQVAEAYKGWNCPIVKTDPTTAETIKYVANAFFTLKVAYACEVARICRVLGVDAKEVMDAVCMDRRINPSHLDPTKGSIPRSSPCLPKDLSALIKHLKGKGYDSKLLKAVYEGGVCDA